MLGYLGEKEGVAGRSRRVADNILFLMRLCFMKIQGIFIVEVEESFFSYS